MHVHVPIMEVLFMEHGNRSHIEHTPRETADCLCCLKLDAELVRYVILGFRQILELLNLYALWFSHLAHERKFNFEF